MLGALNTPAAGSDAARNRYTHAEGSAHMGGHGSCPAVVRFAVHSDWMVRKMGGVGGLHEVGRVAVGARYVSRMARWLNRIAILEAAYAGIV
jgi:hypothetical protein